MGKPEARDRPKGRFSWWWGIGLFLGAAGITYGALYFVVTPWLGRPVAIDPAYSRDYASARASAVEQPALFLAGDEQYQVTWRVLNEGGVDWGATDFYFAPSTAGVPPITLPRDVPQWTVVEVTKLLPADIPADTTWELQGPKGPVSGGHLSLGGPPGITLAGWQENPAQVGKN